MRLRTNPCPTIPPTLTEVAGGPAVGAVPAVVAGAAAPNALGQRQVLGLDGDSVRVDGTQVGVLEQAYL